MKKDNTLADTPSNSEHMSKVGSLTLDVIMGMDNDGHFDDPNLIDELWGYLCDCKSIRERMNYNWELDKEENI